MAVNIIEKHEVEEIKIKFPNARATDQKYLLDDKLTSVESKA